MNLFKTNKIYLDSETVAEQLRSGRQAKNLKLKDVAKKLNINEKHLDSLEKGEYLSLPKGIYGKNFLREYALFLGLNYGQLLKNYETEIGILEPKKPKHIFSNQIVKKHHLWAVPKIVKGILIFLVVAVCFAYLFYRINKIIAPPYLTVDNPSADIQINQTSILVSGRTEVEASLMVNDETVLSDKSGNFFKLINLKNGLNLITITSKKKYSRDSTVIRQILVVE